MIEFDQLEQQNGLDIKALIGALAILVFSSLILGVRIFLTNKIYTTSRNINVLESQYDMLSAENIRLKRELEVLKYRYLSGELPDFEENEDNAKSSDKSTKDPAESAPEPEKEPKPNDKV
ncbi:MAG: hypothetical protein E7K04_03615 [Helicobacter sp.]|nr:hypothetical protein [Helicobacter sp.]